MHDSKDASAFPIEVYERIIEWFHWINLYDEERMSTLLSCALTCRSWYPRSHSRLLFHIQFDDSMRPSAVLYFSKMLEHKPWLRPLVRVLTLSLPDPTGVLLVLSQLLPNLITLRLYLGPLQQPTLPNPDFFLSVSLHTSVRNLEVYHMQPGQNVSAKFVMRLLGCLPNAKYSHIDSLDTSTSPLTAAHRLPRVRVRLESLDLGTCSSHTCFTLSTNLLAKRTSISSLQKMCIRYEHLMALESHGALTKILGKCGSSLRDFAIAHEWRTAGRDVEDKKIDLSMFSSVSQLHRLYIYGCPSAATLASILKSIPSESIEEIHVSPLRLGWLQTDFSFLHQLDETLSSSQYPTLHSARIALHFRDSSARHPRSTRGYTPSFNHRTELLKESFPRLLARGVLGHDPIDQDTLIRLWRYEPLFAP
ncbi:hypothetical protein K474DRAFT_75057 [Panus rudis PR-1116 ss-1]|nr:hypothetical protein K474DRAFT_75057 [Panus rudis PR-1116 ss-1]